MLQDEIYGVENKTKIINYENHRKKEEQKSNSEEKLKIGIDIDEVVCELVKGYLKYVGEVRGLKKEYQEIYSFNLWEVLGVEKQEVFDLMDNYYKTKDFENISLVQGAEEHIKRLEKDFNISFITARPKNIEKQTRDFLKKYFGNLGEVFFSSDTYGGNQEKHEICLERGINLLIEDNGEYSFKYAEKGIKVLLFDKPWNQGVEHENIIRVYNWNEIYAKINELKQELLERNKR